jgi:hypothetical protein
MKHSTSCGFAFPFVALLFSASALPGALTSTQIQSAQDIDVIVIMRDQLPNMPAIRGAREARASALATAQSPILSELQRAGARKTRSFGLINAVATTVSKAEAAHLATLPLVQAVVADEVIRAPKHAAKTVRGQTSSTAPSSASRLCNTLEPEALQLTNTAFANPAIPQAQQVVDGNGQLVTGKGVKVAILADGLDPSIPGFTRDDGSHVFIDYQDFSGDPAGTPTPGEEAFGDASSIAAQDNPNGTPLTFDISQFSYPAHTVPSPCNIRIRGMAPGASIVGLKVFGELGYTTASSLVQAIEYAVVNDDVDVINESFGSAPFPDNANDPISLANASAVEAGVTVVAITGDAGTAGTLESPGTAPEVISAGATTSFRIYAQTDFGFIDQGSGDYIDNNIASFSSGGFSQSGALTPSIVAPGDAGWALCSTNTALFFDCFQFPGNTVPVQVFNGTSQAAPFTAGEAALVIQAYRSTHHGIDPSPALIKQIIMSTAADIGAPSSEQGAGLINALAAVNLALSVRDANGRPKARGETFLNAPTLASISDTPGALEVRSFTITNTGSSTQHLAPNLQTLGAPFAGATLNLQLNSAANYTFFQTFVVPAGAQHLDAAIAFKSSPTDSNPPIVFFALFDPSGREAAFSNPQGYGSGYGHVDVVTPPAGTWTAVGLTPSTASGASGGYTGPVEFTWAAERYVNFGTLKPAALSLAPGASASLTAQFRMPAQSGDLAAAIRFGQSADQNGTSQAEIPISLRTLIPIGPNGGDFTGTLTGGNGRNSTGPTQTFAFDVPNRVKNMSLVLNIPDSGYLLEGLLVDPQGMQLSVTSNIDPSGAVPEFALQLDRYNPQPGRWRFVLLQNFFSSGNQTSLPFTARIGFNTAEATATELPNSALAKLPAGTPVTFPVKITNNGAVAEWYFADARLAMLAPRTLSLQPGCPTSLPGGCALYVLPTEVADVHFAAKSTVPINMDAYNDVGAGVGFTGAPDLWAQRVAPDTVVASLNVPEVPYGEWVVTPSTKGPYGADGAPIEPFITNAVVLMQPFDSAVSADSGDAWADLTLGTATFNPLMLAAGQSGTINVTITPDPTQVGKTVTGFVYIDTFNLNVFTGDEVARIPYSYTISP